MPTTTSGAEFRRFYNDDTFWPDGAWHDDTHITVSGKTVDVYDETHVPDSAEVVIHSGVVLLDADGEASIGLEKHFAQWKKEQSTAVLLVECPKSVLDAVLAAIAAAGGTVKQ